MKALFKLVVPLLFSLPLMAQRPPQQITVPSLREAAANFKTPPRGSGAVLWLTNGGELTRARIVADLDRAAASSVYLVNIGWGSHLKPKYLSPEQLALAKFTVEEASKRGMKVWIQDEGNYPSGFAGGLIDKEYPQLRMQGIVADIRATVLAGQTLTMPLPPDTLGAFSVKGSDRSTAAIPLPVGSQFQWTAPNEGLDPGKPRFPWTVVFVRHVYLSSPTRPSNREDGTNVMDARYSLIDYLDPEATRAWMKLTHEKYKDLFGAEFGKTVLGFFGDEPSYEYSYSNYSYSGFMPWTPRLLEEFQKQKGYDLKPYIPLFFTCSPVFTVPIQASYGTEPYLPGLFTGKLTEEAQRAKADYWDVWSGMFRDSFFRVQAEWCAKNNMEYLVHALIEERMMRMVQSAGDFFRIMRDVPVPGIDNLSQTVPGVVHSPDGKWDVNNNFPKLASSAAHLFGRPQAWAEEGGGLGIDGKYQLDFQLVRGLNMMQLRMPSGPTASAMPQAAMLAWYTNRAGYLMAIGRPAAQVGLYHPTNSMWMGDEEADRSTTKLGWQLLEHQVDWDYFDEQSLSSVAAIADGGFKNLSGQVYRAIVVPSSTVITRTGLERFQAFVKAGGKVIFVGKTPELVVDKTFLNAKDKPDLSFGTLIEPAGDITPRVIAALPKPDVKLDAEFPRLTYMHRSWRDAQMYFFFNESNQAESRMATIAGRGLAQAWDLGTGEIHPISGVTAEGDSVRLPLLLGPYEAKLVVVGPLPDGVATPELAWGSDNTLVELGGDWALDLNGKQVSTPLKSWEDLGVPSFAGPATYRKQFTASAALAGKRVFLEIAAVGDYARVKLNGKELEARAWQPYRWDITSPLKTGSNDLEIQVNAYASASGGRVSAHSSPSLSGLIGPVRLVAR